MRLSVETRREIIRRVPWIRFHANPTPCTARTQRAADACKFDAHWIFTALKRKRTRAWNAGGDYCWLHLSYSGLYSDVDERKRFHTWLDRHYPEL